MLFKNTRLDRNFLKAYLGLQDAWDSDEGVVNTRHFLRKGYVTYQQEDTQQWGKIH
jgi:hypothetical protein